MALPWVRMDTNMPNHDKILALLADPSPKKWQACVSYQFGIMWSGGQGTDGFIPRTALPFVHGTLTTARLLVVHRLWSEHDSTGWDIVNFAERQQLEVVTVAKQAARKHAAEKANCRRWHGPNCWTIQGCARV